MAPSSTRPLPEAAISYSAIDHFRQQSQSRLDKIAKAQGKPSTKISLKDISVDPGLPGDGLYQLVYENKSLDAVLLGQVSTLNQDMKLINHRIGQPEKFYIFHYEPVDRACSLATALLGPEELAQVECKDGWLEPKLEEAKDRFESIKAFDRFCSNSQARFFQKHPELRQAGSYDLTRSVVENSEPGDGQFDLYFHNPATDFFCRGQISTLGSQIMTLGAGTLNAEAGTAKLIGEPQGHEMTDACRMTDFLVGKEEHPKSCVEFSARERTGIKAVDYGYQGFLTATAVWEGLRILTWTGSKIFRQTWYARSFAKWPDPPTWLLRQGLRPLRFGFRGLRQVPTLVRAVGPWVSRVAPAAFRSLASRIPSLIRLAPATAGGGTLAAETGGAAAVGTGMAETGTAVGAGAGVGAGTTAAAVVGSFAAGLLIGLGIEKGQKAVFGRSYTSDGIAAGLHAVLGDPKPQWVDWWDKYMGWVP